MVAACAGIAFALYDRGSGPVKILYEKHNALEIKVEKLETEFAAEREARHDDYQRVMESLARMDLRQKEGYERLSRIEGRLDR